MLFLGDVHVDHFRDLCCIDRIIHCILMNATEYLDLYTQVMNVGGTKQIGAETGGKEIIPVFITVRYCRCTCGTGSSPSNPKLSA